MTTQFSAKGMSGSRVKKRKLLIVEDDFYLRELYEIQARNEEYEVVSVENGEHALVKIKDFLPDIILLDIMLPKMDGVTLLAEIKKIPFLKKIPVVVITNLEDYTIKKKAKELGAVDYFLKVKNTPKVIIRKLKTYL